MLYIDTNWADVFNQNQLTTFEDFWKLQLPIVDDANHGRGGYSKVSRYVVTLPNGMQEAIYIKRQEDYTCSSWRHPFSGIPTFEREFINWQRFKKAQLSTYDLLYFAKRKQGGHQQAILVSRELPAIDLTTYLADTKHQSGSNAQFKQRKALVYSVADLLRRMHSAGLQHGHLTPKHVFIGGLPDQIQSYLIDLEIAREVRWGQRRIMINDLARFSRHLKGSSTTERMRFFKSYLNIGRLCPKSKRLWRILAKHAPR